MTAPLRESKGAADLSDGLEVILAEVGDRLVIGSELLQQPPQFDIAVCLLLQATTRTQAIAIAVEVELQEIARGIAGSPSGSRHGTVEAACDEVECVDKGINEADRIILGNRVVEALRKADATATLNAGTTQARRVLVAGAWASRSPAKVSRHVPLRLATQPRIIQDSSGIAHVRLCTRSRRLVSRGQHANVVTVAMARELAGFMGAMARERSITP